MELETCLCSGWLFLFSAVLLGSLFYILYLRRALKQRDSGDAFLIKKAYFDKITQLPNRNNAEIIVAEQLERSMRHKKHFLLATVKLLNYDKDKIVEFSKLIQDSIRGEDILTHIEKNEFLIVFNEYLEDKNFVVLRRRFDAKIAKAKEFAIEIGKSKYPDDAQSVAELMEKASKQIQ